MKNEVVGAFGGDEVRREYQFVPYPEAKRRQCLSQVKKMIFRCRREDKHQEFKPYFGSYTPKEIEGFFRKEGRLFFSLALIDASNALPLKWLTDKMSPNIVLDILTMNDFSVLAGFLGGQKVMESFGEPTEETRTLVVEKLKILLKLNDPNVSMFIEHNTAGQLKSGLKLTM
jgi:hypothetical protein